MIAETSTEVGYVDCRLVIAGAGGGKTTGMIKEVVEKLSELQPQRFMVVITYTNAATEHIRTEIEKRIRIPQNLFIGTIHAFLNRFILSPYSRLLGHTPFETIFIDQVKLGYKCSNPFAERNQKIKLSDSLLKKGVVCHDKTMEICHKITQNKTMRRAISNRIQMMFVDEYQDSTLTQHEIFKAILDSGNTRFYFVGDPEQYIFAFRYGNSLIKKESKPKCFEEIPIMRLQQKVKPENICCWPNNKRSNQAIVDFLNKFNTQMVQNPFSSALKNNNAKFIDLTDLRGIIDGFKICCKVAEFSEQLPKRFFLSYEGSTFESVAGEFNLSHVSNDSSVRITKPLMSAVNLILGTMGKTRKELCGDLGITELELRRMGVKLLKKINADASLSDSDFTGFLKTILNMRTSNACVCSQSLEKLAKTFSKTKGTGRDLYSTIHKAKGLEADAVLVVAERASKLRKWLETDRPTRFSDKVDECRIGFVGFSRARELLCIACLEDIGDLRIKLRKLAVEIV